MRNLLFLAISFVVLACGNAATQNGTYKPADTSYGEFLISSVNNSGGSKVCADYYISGTYDKTKVESSKQTIRDNNTTTSDTKCDTNGGVGTCALVSKGASSTSTLVVTFYSPTTAADAKSACSSAGGSYK